MSEQKTIEISAPDIESAVAKGIEELGVARDQVMIEVLEEPSRRLLGLGTRQARVRLTVIRAPSTPPPPPTAEAPSDEIIVLPSEKEGGAPTKPEKAAPSERKERPERKERRPRPAKPAAATDDPESEPAFEDEEEAGTSAIPELSDDEFAVEAKAGADIVRDLLKFMGLNATVTLKKAVVEGKEPRHWILDVSGRDLGSLIGRKGETLAALQYLTRMLTSRKLGRRVYLVVDVEGYKTRREAMLRRLAQRMAEQAVQRGRTVAMEPMPPHERRIIHLTLRDHPEVTTESVGEGDKRKVTVIPRHPKP